MINVLNLLTIYQLLQSPHKIGNSVIILSTLQSFSGRIVVINKLSSVVKGAILIVYTQGSVIGPILFIMYTVDLVALVERHGLCPHLYANDMQIYGSCPPSAVHDLQQRLSACMDDVHFWMQSNRLQLNSNKTELLWCTTARRQHQLRGLHFGFCLLTLSRRQRCVTLGSTSTLTSACSLTFSGLSPTVLPFCDNCAVSNDQFHRLFPDSGCRPCADETGLW